ncbi:MAG TPA: NAD(P)/FAD-dependent oxidoreductase, partial [Gemmatimonadales bacterium]|nr:NAD(P)/FAD-dependent oxidoreductase [Gemmatimonadales bacterium]
MSASYDVIIIGGGHNGLVTAAYLARAGVKVLVLERREVLGGACVTEEVWPGYKVSTAAYVNSLLRPEIIRDLELKRHGFQMLPRSPSSFTPFPDGRSLLLGPDKALTHREVSKFSKKDADALPRYEAMLERVADFLEPTLVQTPPNPWSLRPANLVQLGKMGLAFLKLGHDGQKAVEILTGAATPILDRWFESEQLKVTLATDAIIGAMASPSMPGTAYVLFHHVMGECDGVRGVWGYVRGGMGGISNAIAAAAREKGAEIRTNAEVARILVKEGTVQGVAL